jgi:hypothetical protein
MPKGAAIRSSSSNRVPNSINGGSVRLSPLIDGLFFRPIITVAHTRAFPSNLSNCKARPKKARTGWNYATFGRDGYDYVLLDANLQDNVRGYRTLNLSFRSGRSIQNPRRDLIYVRFPRTSPFRWRVELRLQLKHRAGHRSRARAVPRPYNERPCRAHWNDSEHFKHHDKARTPWSALGRRPTLEN